MDDYSELVAALRCNRPGCECQHEANGRGAMLHCPAHDDTHPSLSFAFKNGKPLWKCFSGCDQEAVLAAFVEKGLWHTQREINPTAPGLTLQQYADAKKLPVDFLKSLGLADQRYKGAPAVRIPYPGTGGEVITARFRVAMSGHRFEWKSGAHPMLYGLGRLDEIRRAGWCLIVEGESDCHTLWHDGLPALGVPGKSTWRDVWKQYVDGLAVYVWQEPDAEDFSRKIGASIPALRIVAAPENIKDPSAAHLLGHDVPALLESLKTNAVPLASILQGETAKRAQELATQAARVLAHPDPLQLVEAELQRLGYGGETAPAMIVYLASTARLAAMRAGAMPPHVLLIGPASGGKSYTVSSVRRMFPSEAFHVIDAGSPRALIYDQADLQHRVVVFGEADSLPSGEDNPAASAIRNLLADGALRYSFVQRDEDTGEYITREIVKDGPSVLITTSTRKLGEQLMTRLFTLEIGDEPSHIRAALMTQARIEREGTKDPDAALIAFQAFLQTRAPWQVYIPFANDLAELIGNSIAAPRILRDFARLLSFIRAVAIVRHAHRGTDDAGRVVATVEDYATVRGLVNQIYSDSMGGGSRRIRETVGAVRALLEANPQRKITLTDIAARLGIAKMAASRRAHAAVKLGWLVNKETRKGYPAEFALGETMPAEEGLPTADALRAHIEANAPEANQDVETISADTIPEAFEVIEI